MMEANHGGGTDRSAKPGKILTETYPVRENVLTEPAIHISQEAFPLCEADYLRIKQGGSIFSSWPKTILILSIGMLLIPIAKYLQAAILQTNAAIEIWEWIAPLIGLGIALVLYVLGEYVPYFPNEKKQVMKEMEEHFSTAPRVRHFGEGMK